jgi:hypothetical protein
VEEFRATVELTTGEDSGKARLGSKAGARRIGSSQLFFFLIENKYSRGGPHC